MALIYDMSDLSKLIDDLDKTEQRNDAALSKTLNKSTQFAVDESVKLILNKVELDKDYVEKHLGVEQLASPNKLRAIASATARGTLLNRYPHEVSGGEISVKVNSKGGYRPIGKGIKNANGKDIRPFMINLKSGNGKGIAFRNVDAVAYFEAKLTEGKGSTPNKVSKLNKIKRKAVTNPRGVEVLHSRSINQLFLSVRDDIQDDLVDYMIKTYDKYRGTK